MRMLFGWLLASVGMVFLEWAAIILPDREKVDLGKMLQRKEIKE